MTKTATDNDRNSYVSRALKQLASGKIVLLYDDDDRESEVDMVVGAEFITSETINTFRTFGGGLICLTIHPDIARKVRLPYLDDIIASYDKSTGFLKAMVNHDIPYGERSPFSIPVNHRKTFTGITDYDRSLTIKEFTKIGKEIIRNGSEKPEDKYAQIFAENFRTPGHVFLLRANDQLLDGRKGHTEMSVVLCQLANITPVATICEVMDGSTGKAMTVEKLKLLIESNDSKNQFPYKEMTLLNGQQLIEYYQTIKSNSRD